MKGSGLHVSDSLPGNRSSTNGRAVTHEWIRRYVVTIAVVVVVSIGPGRVAVRADTWQRLQFGRRVEQVCSGSVVHGYVSTAHGAEPGPSPEARGTRSRRAGCVTVLVRAIVGPGVDHGLRCNVTNASRRRLDWLTCPYRSYPWLTSHGLQTRSTDLVPE